MIEEEPQWDYGKNARMRELREKRATRTAEENRELAGLQGEWDQYTRETKAWSRQQDEAEFLALDPEQKLLALFRLLKVLLNR